MTEHQVFDHFVRIRRIENRDMPHLIEAARKDNHAVIKPTHVLTKKHDIVGFLSVGAVPLVFVWSDTQKMTTVGTLNALCLGEDMLQSAGADSVCIPVPPESPLYPHMPSFGYRPFTETILFTKEFKR